MKILQVTLGAGATQVTTSDIPVKQVLVQNNAAHSCRVGDSAVTSSVGVLLNASGGAGQGGGSINLGPFWAHSENLKNIWLIGTQNDVIDVAYL